MKASGLGSKNEAALPRPRYQSKTIAVCTNACAAATRLRGKSFLVAETPNLPLPNCDRTCYCKFTDHDDRRIKDDRRYPAEEIDQLEGLTTDEDVRDGDDRRRKKAQPYRGIY